LNEPRDVLPYHEDAADERITSPISELLFPTPLLALNYTYTTTGVLEQMPSFANGDVRLQDAYVYINESGEIVAPVPPLATDPLTATTTDVTTDTATTTSDGMTTTVVMSATDALTATDQYTMTQAMLDALIATGEVTRAQQVVVTYRWNPQLRWSDGEPVTAHDSVFAYELAKMSLLGDEAATRCAFLDHYEVVDEHTTRAYLHPDFVDPAAINVAYTDPTYYLNIWTPLPYHILKDDTAAKLFTFAWSPIGYGPYMIDRREEGGIRMQRNPYYYGQQPQQEEVLLLFMPSFEVLRTSIVGGSLDVAVADDIDHEQFPLLNRDQELGLYHVAYVPSPIWEHLDFNLDVRFLQDIQVRQAIAYGTNRQAMVDRLFDGKIPVMDSWIVPQHWASAPSDQITLYPYNPDEANRLLDSVSTLDSNDDGVRDPVSINLLTTENSPLRAEIARMFQENMAAIGIVVTIETVPTQDFYTPEGPLFRREFHLAQFAWLATPKLDGLSLWSCRAVPSEHNNWTGNNFAGWCFRDADQAIRVANTAQDLATRQAAYLTQQQLFTQELPALPLFQRLSLMLMTPQITNVRPDPIAPVTWNITQWQK
jgi:peptide/nickel transport system substrate-binding protein